MIVLDAHAILGFYLEEVCAEEVAGLLTGESVLSAMNAAEIVDLLTRRHGRDPDDVNADIVLLTTVGLRLADLTPELGFAAGRLRASHFDRARCAVSMADCAAAATALALRVPLATADPALASLMRASGGDVHALPDSQGARP